MVCGVEGTEVCQSTKHCKTQKNGVDFTGEITSNDCKYWSEHNITSFTETLAQNNLAYPDGSRIKAKNFCRNPLPNLYDFLWCYGGSEGNHIKCDEIPYCPGLILLKYSNIFYWFYYIHNMSA